MARANTISAVNCSFRYETGSNQFELSKIDLTLGSGSASALIGPSGSGKTTLGLILAGLLLPDSGSSEIDSISARKYIEEHPGRVAYLPQRPHIVTGSLAENIALEESASEIDRNRVRLLVAQCQLNYLVESSHEGIDQVISSSTLSVGQIQRVGLARALYTNPTFLLLDEPTSALDADTEYAISQVLENLADSCTVLIIAHRLATIRNLSTIYLLEGGRIVNSGTFSHLQRTSKLVERQAELLGMAGPGTLMAKE